MMTDERQWVVIREDESGNRYRVGRYASREEAERAAARLSGHQHYLVERIDPHSPS